jgi:uncharacterized protein
VPIDESSTEPAGNITVDLPSKVAGLRQRQAYPETTARVEAKETHMSWVFLTDTHVYKLKKPVKYHFLDLSTAERRRLNCEEEVRLNRRLAESIYEGVVPLTREADGNLRLNGKGAIVDWLVQMKRLPDALTLSQKIHHQQLPAEEVTQVAQVLTDFYRHCLPAPWSGPEYLNRLKKMVRQLQKELLEYPLPAGEVKKATTLQQKYLLQNANWFENRAATGKIVEGHGDLKPEHIFLTKPPVIIDCLEFNQELRLLDVADELAFLAVECEALQAGWVGERILQHYQTTVGDAIPAGSMHFYKSVRAGMRAMLAARHLREPRYQRQDKWMKQALRYLGLSIAVWKEPK